MDELSQMLYRVRRVVEHPYTTECGELARMARLACDLTEADVCPADVALCLRWYLVFDAEYAHQVKVGVLLAEVRRRRVAWLTANGVKREETPDNGCERFAKLTATRGYTSRRHTAEQERKRQKRAVQRRSAARQAKKAA